MAQDAFGQHYLTDAFSAGHMRTARLGITQHWNAKVPMFYTNLCGQASGGEVPGRRPHRRCGAGDHRHHPADLHPAEVRGIDKEVGGRLGLDFDLTGRWQSEFNRLKTAP